MEIELRPLSTGEVLDRTFRFYRAHFLVFVGIAGLAALMETAGNALQVLTFRFALMDGAQKLIANFASGIGVLIQMLLVLVAASLVFAAIAREVIALHQNGNLGIAGAYRAVLPRWFRYVRLAVMWWLAAGWPFIVAILLVVLIPGLGVSTRSPMFVGAVGLWVVVMFLMVPLCIWLFCRYSLCMPASAMEDMGVLQSLKRSVTLSKGLRWRIFLLLMVVYVLQSILMMGLMIPILGLFLNLAKTHGVLPLGAVIYEIAIGFVLIALITPIYIVGLTLIYIDARIRKEGFDIELRMQRSAEPPPVAVAGVQPEGSAPLAME